MKMSMAKENVEVLNKVNGKYYLITELSGESAFAKEIINKEPELELGENTVQINKNNCICFRFIEDHCPVVLPEGYYVKDGRLMKNGSEVTEQGQIYVERILGALPGFLLLAVRSPKQEDYQDNYVNIKSYYTRKDKFRSVLANAVPMPEVIKLKSGAILLKYSHTHMELEEGGNQIREIFDCAGVIVVGNEGLIHTGGSFESAIGKQVARDEDVVIFEKDDKQVYLVDASKENDLFIRELCISNITELSYSPVFEGCVIKSDDEFLFISRYQQQTNGTAPSFANRTVMDEIKSYNHLVDLQQRGADFTAMLADDDYNVKVIKAHETNDRGQVVTVEEFHV